MPTKVMITLFALFAEIERDLVSERTKEGLAKARAFGKFAWPSERIARSNQTRRPRSRNKKPFEEGRFEDVGRANRRTLAAHAGPIYSFAEANGEKLEAPES